MNIADEGTTAHLKAGVQNSPTVVQMNAQSALQVVNQCFQTWGLPKQIKIDNGHPFVIPRQIDLPTKSKMWWIGLGIKVIQNDSYTPQQNGVVECLQGIMNNWSNPSNYSNLEALQDRLDQESDFQRNHYQIPSKDNKNRIELYPSLKTNPRKYNPAEFDMQLVYEFLSQQVWKRRVSSNGQLFIFSNRIYVGTELLYQDVTITFDPQQIQWIIRKENGTLLKTSKMGIPTEKEIKDFAIISKNKDTT